MSGYYVYLISSLPGLRFGEKPPLSYARFLETCRGLISEEDLAVLKALGAGDIYDYKGKQPTLKKWRAFEIALRNELVRIRASRRHVDPMKYVRLDGEADISLNHIAINAYRSPSIIESERMLDRSRWDMLDELAIGHYFDMDLLVIYACKLLIVEKWERINLVDKAAALEAALATDREGA